MSLQLVSFGAGILNGIDPNPDNFVCASILHTSAHQVGCLMRLEPNKQVQASRYMHCCFVLTRITLLLRFLPNVCGVSVEICDYALCICHTLIKVTHLFRLINTARSA